MNRSRAGALVLALLAVLAFAAAAATLGDTSGGDGAVGGDGGGLVPAPGGSPSVVAPDGPVTEVFRVLYLLLIAAVGVAGLAALYAFYREYGARGLAAAAVALAAVVAIGYLFLEGLSFPSQSAPPRNGSGPLPTNPANPGGGSRGSESIPTASPPVTLAFGILLALFVGGLVIVRATGGDEFSPGSDVPDGGGGDAAALGRVAGRAADRIDRGAVVDNEVYRAWREMTDRLDVPAPDATTPAEFADAAVDAGLDRGDVDELTRLFEEVRYGGGDPTPERERRAVDALRRIEEAYA